MDVEETAFFQANGVVLVLWSREKLAADMGIEDDGARWGGVALAHKVGSGGRGDPGDGAGWGGGPRPHSAGWNAEVARAADEARAEGAEITREPAPTFYGGYAGGF